MFTVIVLGWVMYKMPRVKTDPTREWLYTLHKSFGLTILALTVLRLVWRALHPPPAHPPGLARFEKLSADATHGLLYVVLIGMPISGLLISARRGPPATFFDLFTFPALPHNETPGMIGDWVHLVTGQWLVYALIALHILGVAWHVAVKRDGTLERMLPEQHE